MIFSEIKTHAHTCNSEKGFRREKTALPGGKNEAALLQSPVI